MKRYILFWMVSFFFFSFAWAQSPDLTPAPPVPVPAPPPDPPIPPPPPAPKPAEPPSDIPKDAPKERLVSLDFDNVDIPVLVKFIGELTLKNFVIDEQIRGKITLFSPVKIPVSSAYDVFLSVLDMKGFKVVPAGPVYQIMPAAAVPPPRSMHFYTVKNGDVDEISKALLGIVSRVEPPRPGMGTAPSGTITGRVDVVTDKTTNSLIITASDQDYPIVEKMIGDLDVPRRQVYVEALVMEMASDTFRQLGTDLGALFGYVRGDAFTLGGFQVEPPALLSALTSTTSSLTGIKPINARAFLQAIQKDPKVNVLSTPQLLASDRQKAEIVVGQNVPFPGASSQTVGGNVQVTVERKDVGITLRLTPTIMANKKVKLEVFQEISSVVETAVQSSGGQDLGPTTNKRSATTNVVVNDGQTAVIGGLVRDNLLVTETGIPWLRRIPLLGWFFKSESRRVEKTNLLIFITPYIVPDEPDKNSLDAIRRKKLQGTLDFMGENEIEQNPGQKEAVDQMTSPPQ